MSDPNGFTVLDGSEVIEQPRERKRETSEMWRRIVDGDRVFIPEYKPGQLTYWYRKANAAGFKLKMSHVKVNDVWGTVMERSYVSATEPVSPSELGVD